MVGIEPTTQAGVRESLLYQLSYIHYLSTLTLILRVETTLTIDLMYSNNGGERQTRTDMSISGREFSKLLRLPFLQLSACITFRMNIMRNFRIVKDQLQSSPLNLGFIRFTATSLFLHHVLHSTAFSLNVKFPLTSTTYCFFASLCIDHISRCMYSIIRIFE